MIDQALCAATFLAALGSGLIAGVFFAFSAFVLTALSRLPDQGGIAAMQAITAAIKNPLFLIVFFGMAAPGLSRARSICSLAACSISTSRSP